MPIFNNILAGSSGAAAAGDAAYKIERSLRFESGDDAHLKKSFSSAGNRRKWTLSFWVKGCSDQNDNRPLMTYGTADNADYFDLKITSTGGLQMSTYSSYYINTDAVFRDPSAWYHFVIAVDTTQSTAADRVKLYVNGVETTRGGSDPTFGQVFGFNNNQLHVIGAYANASGGSVTGSRFNLADYHFVDGQALAPTDFGEFDDNNVWQPKEFTEHSGTDSTDDVYAWKATLTNGQNNGGWYFTQEDNASSLGLTGATGGHPNELGGNTLGGRTGYTVLGCYGTFATANSVTAGSDVINKDAAFDVGTSTRSFVYNKTVNKVWVHDGSDWVGGGDPATTSSTPTFLVPSTGRLSFGISMNTNNETLTLASIESSVYSGTATGISFRGNDEAITLSSSNTVATCTSSTSGYNDAWATEMGDNSFGGNSFHLDFSDTSSDSALGTDAAGSNDWTVMSLTAAGSDWDQSRTWSGGSTSGSMYSGAWSQVFNGVQTSTYSDGNSVYVYQQTATLNFSPALPSGAIQIWGRAGSSSADGDKVTFTDGTSTYTTGDVTTQTAQWIDVDSGNSLSGITSVTVHSGDESGAGMVLGAIKIGSNQLVNTSITDPEGKNIDSLIDTPTDYTASGNNGGNYATLNPLNMHNSNNSLPNGNLEFTTSGSDGCLQESTIGMSSGKFYFEVVYSASGTGQLAGIRKSGKRNYDDSYIYVGTGNKYTNGGSGEGYGATLANGDVIGTAFDADNGTLTFYKNGVSQGQAFSGISGTYSFLVGSFGTAPTGVVNFGQRPFAYTPPTGYVSLCTQNLPDPTIADGSTAFDAVLYTGNGTSQTISGLGFSPDWVWTKLRSAGFGHRVWDTVRGATKRLEPHATTAEDTESTALTAFTSDGFSVGSEANVNTTYLGGKFVAWCWDAGTSNTSVSAGDLNSSAYDQSEDWSGGSVTGAPHSSVTWADAFDGAFGTGVFTYATNTSTLTMPSNTTWSDKIEVYALKYGGTLYVNGTDVGASMSGFTSTEQWHDITSIVGSSGTLSSIGVSDVSTNYVKLFAVRLDGKLLVDSGESVTDVPSIDTTYRANPSAGFSIVKYTGNGHSQAVGSSTATVGHGLNAQPELIIVKNRDDSQDWSVYHVGTDASNPENYYLSLNKVDARNLNTTSDKWSNISPTTSVFTLGSSGSVNRGNDEHIAYCFAPVEGYSKFGSYEGNGNADGPFIYTGFKPRWILIKNIDNYGTGYDWFIFDTARDTLNVTENTLKGNLGGAEYDSDSIDILSNGFKLKATTNGINLNAHTHVYAAFAEHPFKTARAR